MSASRAKPTLYQLLGVPPSAGTPEIRTAFRAAMDTLEAQRRTLPPDAFDEQAQLLRVALSTLVDPVSRDGYDEHLRAAERSRALATAAAPSDAMAASAQVRAEAMALRADAIALRADSLLLKAGLPASTSGAGSASGPGAFLLAGMWRIVGALGLLFILGMLTFGLTRCVAVDQAQKREAMDKKASEQAALQDYYQTYGVRPASIAEMHQMEAARRQEERDERRAEQARRQREQAARQFEEESHRIGAEVSENLRRADQAAAERAERVQALKFEVEQIQLEIDLAKDDGTRRRLQLLKQQKQEQLKQL